MILFNPCESCEITKLELDEYDLEITSRVLTLLLRGLITSREVGRQDYNTSPDQVTAIHTCAAARDNQTCDYFKD